MVKGRQSSKNCLSVPLDRSSETIKKSPNLEQLENSLLRAQRGKQVDILEKIYQYIEQDPEDLFKKTHIVDHPEANFQVIALAKLSDKTWQEISSELNITLDSLGYFYQYYCRKFAPKLQKNIEKILSIN
jgi:hypothetical protein